MQLASSPFSSLSDQHKNCLNTSELIVECLPVLIGTCGQYEIGS